jgi:hypothetical protein
MYLRILIANFLLMLIRSISIINKPYLINSAAVESYYQGYRFSAFKLSEARFIGIYTFQKRWSNTINIIGEYFNFGTQNSTKSIIFHSFTGVDESIACEPNNSTCIQFQDYFTSEMTLHPLDSSGYVVFINTIPCNVNGVLYANQFSGAQSGQDKLTSKTQIDSGYICNFSTRRLTNGKIVLKYDKHLNGILSLNILLYDTAMNKLYSSIDATKTYEKTLAVSEIDSYFSITYKSNHRSYLGIYNLDGSVVKSVDLQIGDVDFIKNTKLKNNKILVTWLDNSILKGYIMDASVFTQIGDVVIIAQVENPYSNTSLNHYRIVEDDDGFNLLYRGFRNNRYILFYKKLNYFKYPDGTFKLFLNAEELIISQDISFNSQYAVIEQPDMPNKNNYIYFWFAAVVAGGATSVDQKSYYTGLNKKIQTASINFQKCPADCLDCTDDGVCNQCPDTFVLNNGCSCPEDYYFIHDECTSCDIAETNCAEFNRSTCQCSMCFDTFTLYNNECICQAHQVQRDKKCVVDCVIPNCLQIKQGQCECKICNNGYELYNGQCKSQMERSCQEYDPEKGCIKCIDGLVLNFMTNTCECEARGQFFDNLECVTCASFCDICKDISSCQICTNPFILDNSLCVCPKLFFIQGNTCFSYIIIIIAVLSLLVFVGLLILIYCILKRRCVRKQVTKVEPANNVIEIAKTDAEKPPNVECPNESHDLSKEYICEICMTHPKAVLLDCGSEIPHLTCFECFEKLKQADIILCPFDRNVISNLL